MQLAISQRLAAIALCTAFAACGGGGGTSPAHVAPPAPSPTPSGPQATASLQITVPPKGTRAGKRRIAYVSPSTQHVVITVNALPPQTFVLPPPTGSGAGTTYNLSLSVPVGNDTFAISLTDASSNVLSSGSATVPITYGGANLVDVTPAGIVAYAEPTQILSGRAGYFPSSGAATITAGINAYDIDGNQISGSFNAPVAFAVHTSNLNIGAPSASSFSASTDTITIAASGAAGATQFMPVYLETTVVPPAGFTARPYNTATVAVVADATASVSGISFAADNTPLDGAGAVQFPFVPSAGSLTAGTLFFDPSGYDGNLQRSYALAAGNQSGGPGAAAVNLATATLTPVPSASFTAFGPLLAVAFQPDGQFAWTVDGSGNVARVNPATQAVVLPFTIAGVSGCSAGPLLSVDASQQSLVFGCGGKVFIHALTGGAQSSVSVTSGEIVTAVKCAPWGSKCAIATFNPGGSFARLYRGTLLSPSAMTLDIATPTASDGSQVTSLVWDGATEVYDGRSNGQIDVTAASNGNTDAIETTPFPGVSALVMRAPDGVTALASTRLAAVGSNAQVAVFDLLGVFGPAYFSQLGSPKASTGSAIVGAAEF